MSSLENESRAAAEAGTAREDDARQRLLDAAGPVFAQHGFDHATVRDICGNANVNVASVGYYFGDKFGLYREVIRSIRSRCSGPLEPLPPDDLPARDQLHLFIVTMLQRLLSDDDAGWESQLLMREMIRPTEAFAEMVQEMFRPRFERLTKLIAQLSPAKTPIDVLEKLALSVIGQCLYYRVGGEVVRKLIPPTRLHRSFDVRSLAAHITGVTLAATQDGLAKQLASELPVLNSKSELTR